MSESPIIRSDGVTPAEQYLKRLCEHSFLSLWSYPGVFRDQGQKQGGDGKEVCDLLVVFENDIVIFSDKNCTFPRSGKLRTDWNRWFKHAILNSAKQVWGAERWIKSFPDRLFLDRACTQRFPIDLPSPGKARFHRIVVAHDVSPRCREELSGSGSLVISPQIEGRMHYTADMPPAMPFMVGWIDPTQGFVHVLDDTSLSIVLRTLDTAPDLIAYLKKKEAFFSSGRLLVAAGEEELLASYLAGLNTDGEHDFVFEIPENGRVALDEGHWQKFCRNPKRLAQIDANRISYAWDDLIEAFSRHALAGTQHYTTCGVADVEKCLRFMAREGRTRRRLLAHALIEIIETTRGRVRRTRVVGPSVPGDPYYVFLLLPRLPNIPDERYRITRREMLSACCRVAKLVYPDAKDIVGIATETEPSTLHSEDALYLNARDWGPDDDADAKGLQADLGLLVNLTQSEGTMQEYPAGPIKSGVAMKPRAGPNPRNKLCPCGSGKKYKKCHGR